MKKKIVQGSNAHSRTDRKVCMPLSHFFSLPCRTKLLVMMKQCLLMKTSVRLLNMASHQQLAGVWEWTD